MVGKLSKKELLAEELERLDPNRSPARRPDGKSITSGDLDV